MIPKLEISAPELLVRCFYFPPLYGPREKLDKDIFEFTEFFNKKGGEVMTAIEKLSGFEWSLPRIPVYLVPDNPMLAYSFTRGKLEDGVPGIIQKIGRGPRDIHTHIHELVHVNQMQSSFFSKENGFAFAKDGKRNDDLLELCADIITLYILRTIFKDNPEYESDFFDFLQNTNEKNKLKHKELADHLSEWDLSIHSLKYYLERDIQNA